MLQLLPNLEGEQMDIDDQQIDENFLNKEEASKKTRRLLPVGQEAG